MFNIFPSFSAFGTVGL